MIKSIVSKKQVKQCGSLISKVLIDSNTSHDEFVLINTVLQEYDNMKEDIKSKIQRHYQLIKTFNVLINNAIILFSNMRKK